MFSETNLQQELEMIQVNVISLIHLTKLFLKRMLNNKSGWILNVGSTGSFVPGSLVAVYGGTKSLVLSFSEALASELKGTGVSVTCLCPGFTYTGFQERVLGKAPTLRQQRLFMDAAKVARTGYRALGKGRGMVLPGPINSFLFSFLIRFLFHIAIKLTVGYNLAIEVIYGKNGLFQRRGNSKSASTQRAGYNG
jgi:uncharacterized protein